MSSRISTTDITLDQDDITKHQADAIVNAANSTLLGGGGVDGAIHRAGGPAILEACKQIRAQQGGCPPGEAVITTAGEMLSTYVIHTVGPIWHGGEQGEPETLANCYKNSLAMACEHGCKTIAFPSVSTGVYGYPVEAAATVGVRATREFLKSNPDKLARVTWVLFDDQTFLAYKKALSS